MSNTIQLMPGLTWETLPAAREYVSINRDVVIGKLSRCAAEWREARDTNNLDDVMGSVGALLVDFAFMLEMTPTEIVNLLSGQPETAKEGNKHEYTRTIQNDARQG